MATDLKKFSEAYATMTVATYQPMILKWVSGWTICTAAATMAWRVQKAKRIDLTPGHPTAQALIVSRMKPSLPSAIQGVQSTSKPAPPSVVDNAGRRVSNDEVRPVDIAGFPDAVVVGDSVYPLGVLNARVPNTPVENSVISRAIRWAIRRPVVSSAAFGDPHFGAQSLPTFLSGSLGVVEPGFDFEAERRRILSTMLAAARNHAAGSGHPLVEDLRDAVRLPDKSILYEFWPTLRIEEALSPIGIAHFYRQLYFNVEEGVGPIEQAFTIAPLETLEVVYELTRRQVHEEIVEVGTETVSETAVETKNLDEVSDKVSSMVQRDSSAAMSANASGGIGVWEVGASASASYDTSSQRSKEVTTRNLKEVTKRASERITKSFSLRVRDLEEITTVNLTHRTIKNESANPVSYGLRRVLRRVLVKVQDLGPRLVWQLYVRAPGAGLARSRFVHFREAEPIAIPEVPPGMPPRPKGGTDTGTTSSDLAWDNSRNTWYATIVIHPGSDRRIVAVSIDSIQDLEGGGKDDPAPSPRNDVQWGPGWDSSTNTFKKYVAVLQGDALSVQLSYTYAWEPAQQVLDEWEAKRKQMVAQLTQEALNEQFEREKTLITEQSKIRSRPANDLRTEERYEVLNRLVSHLFGRGDDPSDPTPLEIEYFHRYFDIDGMFVYTHPSWWKPRYAPAKTSLERPAYEITAESDPAPLGSSLGWIIQIDGDDRRNEFLNSPWLRVCMPIRPEREREAIGWLSRHVEGEIGYEPDKDPLKKLLATIEEYRTREKGLGLDGPDYVTVKSSPGGPHDPQKPEGVYPVIQEFEVTVPTDGFVYNTLTVST
jgi:hypothetical protein